MRPSEILPFWITVNLGAMAMKGYSTFHRSPELEPHHKMQFSVIPGLTFLVCVCGGSFLSVEIHKPQRQM